MQAELIEQLQAVLGDRYTVLREIGQGGMAFVFLADDNKHHRQVAIKLLRPELSPSIGADRFLREIDVLSALQHPYILPMYDSGAESDLLYFVMPFIEGESLKERLIREPQLPLPDALVIARQVAAALAYAHERGIIHRDIKPENILLSAGEAVVADFGIARAVRAAGGQRLTETGLSVGTPAYMSPEHAAGEDAIDGRTDLYSLGCVLYEMLVGQPPFTGATLESIMRQHLTVLPQPVSSIRGTIPPQVEAAVARALAKSPADRFASAGHLVEALDVAAAQVRLSSGSIPVPLGLYPEEVQVEPRKSGRGPWVALGGALGVVAVLLVGAVLWLAGGDDRVRLTVLPFENLGTPGDEYFTDGITDEITTRLGGVSGLAVVGRQSALRYRGTDRSVGEIGEELGVEYLLQATISWETGQSDVQRVRVRVQLIRTNDATQVWADVFDEEMTELFAVQTRIAERVVDALGVTLLDQERGILAEEPTTNMAAYDLYLRGVDLLDRTTREDDYRAAQRLLESAVAEDPTFARAWARLARAHAYIYWYYFDRTPQRLDAAREAADRAWALAPDNPDAHMAMAEYHYFGLLNFSDALRELDAVLGFDAFEPNALLLMGAIQRRQGEWEAAIETLERALAAEPLSPEYTLQAGIAQFYAGNVDEAEQHFRRTAELAPEVLRPSVWLATMVLGERGDTAAARRWLTRADSAAPRKLDPQQWMHWSVVRALETPESPARERLATLFVDAPFRHLAGAELAWIHGDERRMVTLADSARLALQASSDAQPDEPRHLSELGIALALVGQHGPAVAAARRATEVRPVAQDAVLGPLWQRNLAQVYVILGAYDSAASVLAPLLPTPGTFSRHWFTHDPIWDRLRAAPEGAALLGGN